jgi:hypothetical protein
MSLNSHRRIPSCIVPLLLVLPLGAFLPSSAHAELTNGDAERIAPGGVPDGWRISSRKTGYSVVSVSEGAAEGRTCIRLAWQGEGEPGEPGNVMQVLPGELYRGKRIRFRAAVRTEGAVGRLWLRETRERGRVGVVESMDRNPITSGTWERYEIVADLSPDAVRLEVGCMIRGTGAVYLDDASLSIVGDAPKPLDAQPAAPLSERGLDNLLAFSRMFGVIRHFHPSDEAAEADWDRIAVGGVRVVEAATGPEELARILGEVFHPVAPTVQIFPTGRDPGPVAPPRTRKARAWRHLGYGPGGGASFQSSRVDLDPGTAADEAYPDPKRPWTADLPGGVSCRVPLALPADDGGTLPPGREPLRWALREDLLPVAEDRSSRLGAVVIAWNLLEHFYPYFDSVRIDFDAVQRTALREAAENRGERAFLDTLRRMTASVRDAAADVKHESEVLGLFLPLSVKWVGSELVVTAAAPGSGLGPGDIIESIDDRPVKDLRDSLAQVTSGATPQFKRWRLEEEILRCEDYEPRTIRARSFAKNDEVVQVSLRPLDPSGEAPRPARPEPIAELEPGIWYVDASRFDTWEFRRALPQLTEAKGIVFDFREGASALNYTALLQHLSRGLMTGPQHHIPIVRFPDGRRLDYLRSNEWEIVPANPYLSAKKVFLTGGGSVGIAETCLEVVEGNHLGTFVGEPTAGTSGDQSTVTLPGGYSMSWTGARVLKQDAARFHGVGILPSVPARPTRQGLAEGRDEIIETAVKTLTS